ncbi:hypothetical protein [Acinetobacter haemolyticus]|uniref:hypothetical protein n=1 Tax=Acinetobacter haemolyticus TaxID=29430 RepID=UPI003F57F814
MKYQVIFYFLLVLFANPTYAADNCENEQILNALIGDINFSFVENLEEYLDRRDKVKQKFVKESSNEFINKIRELPLDEASLQKNKSKVTREFWLINQRFDYILSDYISGGLRGRIPKYEYHIFRAVLKEESGFELNSEYEMILKTVIEAKSLHEYKLFIAQLNNDSNTYADEIFSFNTYDLVERVIEKYLNFSLLNIQQVSKENIIGGQIYNCNATLLLKSKAFLFNFSIVNDEFSHWEGFVAQRFERQCYPN